MRHLAKPPVRPGRGVKKLPLTNGEWSISSGLLAQESASKLAYFEEVVSL